MDEQGSRFSPASRRQATPAEPSGYGLPSIAVGGRSDGAPRRSVERLPARALRITMHQASHGRAKHAPGCRAHPPSTDEDQVRQRINHLLRIGALHRGLVVPCSECEGQAFQRIELLGETNDTFGEHSCLSFRGSLVINFDGVISQFIVAAHCRRVETTSNQELVRTATTGPSQPG